MMLTTRQVVAEDVSTSMLLDQSNFTEALFCVVLAYFYEAMKDVKRPPPPRRWKAEPRRRSSHAILMHNIFPFRAFADNMGNQQDKAAESPSFLADCAMDPDPIVQNDKWALHHAQLNSSQAVSMSVFIAKEGNSAALDNLAKVNASQLLLSSLSETCSNLKMYLICGRMCVCTGTPTFCATSTARRAQKKALTFSPKRSHLCLWCSSNSPGVKYAWDCKSWPSL